MKKIWSIILGYLNIEPDADIARAENKKAIKLILMAGIAGSILRIVLERMLFGQARYEAFIGFGILIFFLIFCLINWLHIDRFITVTMEVVIVGMLIMVAVADYYPGIRVSAFLFLILLAMLPPLIFEKPWKVLLIVLAAGICAFLLNLRVEDAFVRNENIVRIVPVTFLAGVFSTYYAHSRIRSVHMRKSTQVVAEHDPLTGIFNRAGGIRLIRDSIERHESGAFMIIDIDDFKLVNDQYGHQKGDEILKAVAGILQSSFKKTDIVMRMGGDEFIIYAFGMVDYSVSCKRLEQLNASIRTIIVNEQDGNHVTVSIGGAINDGSYPTYESLYKAADQYLYQTKARGKDGYSLLGASFR